LACRGVFEPFLSENTKLQRSFEQGRRGLALAQAWENTKLQSLSRHANARQALHRKIKNIGAQINMLKCDILNPMCEAKESEV